MFTFFTSRARAPRPFVWSPALDLRDPRITAALVTFAGN